MQRLFWMTEIGTLFDPLANDGEARIIALAEAPGHIMALCPAASGTAAAIAGFPYVAIIEVAAVSKAESPAERAAEPESGPAGGQPADQAARWANQPAPVVVLYNRRFTRVIN